MTVLLATCAIGLPKTQSKTIQNVDRAEVFALYKTANFFCNKPDRNIAFTTIIGEFVV